MARTSIFATAAAGAMILSALPFAFATDQLQSSESPEPVQNEIAHEATPPALNANMLAMNMCGERDRIVGELEQHFQENVTAVGMVDDNAVVEVFVSDSGTWTIIATGTDGMSCVLSAGEGWESTTMIRGADA
ncbi:MAG: hypothetical protein ACXIVF_06345 [Rhizobiaceae bacterium]